LDGGITTVQFRAKSAELTEARAAVESQIEAARSRLARLEEIERGKDALISHYASLMPQGLTDLSSEERNRVYKMMRLHVLADREGGLTAEWGCNVLTTPLGKCRIQGR
jgi:hypothetical protein